MLDPRHRRNLALGYLASGCVACAAAFLLGDHTATNWVHALLVIYGLTAIVFGGGTALLRHLDLRATQALARGEDLIARWRVDPVAWHAFVARDQQRHEGRELANELSLSNAISEDGIEVIVGRQAVQVGESIHRLTGGVPEVTAATFAGSLPATIELQLYYPGGGHGASGVSRAATRSVLRFPVGEGAWKEARAVVAHFSGDSPREKDFFHGKGDGTDPEDLTKCFHCGYETHKLMSRCPRCGNGMQSKRWSRRYGWMLLAIGVPMSVVMGWVLSVTGAMLLHPGVSFGGSRFSGTTGQGWLYLSILWSVEVFAVSMACYGLWQVVTGQRSKRVIYFAVGLCVAILLAAHFI